VPVVLSLGGWETARDVEDWIIRRLTAVGELLYGEDELILRWMRSG
jgi:hypothetical protein